MSTQRDEPSSQTDRASSHGRRTTKRSISLGFVLLMLLLAAAAWHRTDQTAASQPDRGRAMPHAAAQATPVPPIATCPPPPVNPGSTASPPGLYPYVRVREVTIFQEQLPDSCPTTRMILRICIGNGGPAPMGSFLVRIQGCGVGTAEVLVHEVDMFGEQCIEIPGASIPPGGCAIMLDPTCTARCCFDRHWTGSVVHPAPLPTCLPTGTAGTPTAVGTAMATDDRGTAAATVESVETPGGTHPVWMPWAGAEQ